MRVGYSSRRKETRKLGRFRGALCEIEEGIRRVFWEGGGTPIEKSRLWVKASNVKRNEKGGDFVVPSHLDVFIVQR